MAGTARINRKSRGRSKRDGELARPRQGTGHVPQTHERGSLSRLFSRYQNFLVFRNLWKEGGRKEGAMMPPGSFLCTSPWGQGM